MSESYLVIELNQQPVELCKLLKIANLVSGGGEAKVVISEGYVLLNGEVEYQKRKKVYHEDVIEFNGEVVQLIINEALTEMSPELLAKESPESLPELTVEQEDLKPQVSVTKSTAKKSQSQAKNKTQSKEKPKKKTTRQPNEDSVSETTEQNNAQVIMPRKRRPISF